MSNHSEVLTTLVPFLVSPPRHSLSDYFVLILLSLCIAIGVPMTVMTSWQLMQRLRVHGWCRCGPQTRRARSYGSRIVATRTPSGSSTLTPLRRNDLLKLQLNIADLMVLTFYAFSKVVWTLTYNWRGGMVLCKLVRFFSTLSFHMCSNSVACIGLDRMINLLQPNFASRLFCGKILAREHVMVMFSCALALMSSLPQLWIWTVVELTPNWHQCVTKWADKMRYGKLSEEEEKLSEIYSIFHLLTIFWIPCAIIATSYIVIVVKVLLHLKEPSSNTGNPQQAGRESIPNEIIPIEENLRSHSANFRNPQMKFGKGILRCGRLTRFLCRQTLTILTVYILCWGPYNALTLWTHFEPQFALMHRTMLRFLQEMIVVNSVINPFLYACDVYHQMVDDRRRQDPNTCLCCFFSCPCALVEDSDVDSVEDL